MRWGFFLFVLFLPLYLLRFPVYIAGANIGIPFLEIAAYGIAVAVFLCDSKGSISAIKNFFSANKLLLAGIIFLWIGLIAGISQSNSTPVSLGIVRGWFFAPFTWFLILIVARKKESLDSLIALALALSAGAVSLYTLLFPHFNQDARMTGFFGSPNYLAMVVAPLIPFVVYELLAAFRPSASGRSERRLALFYSWFFIFGICFIAVFFSFSFGAWLGLASAIAAVISFWAVRFYKKIFWALMCFGGAATLAIFAVFHARIIEKIHSRMGLWHAAWNMGTSHPLFGIGEGMFQTAYQTQKHLIPYPVPLESALHPHNIFLTFWLYAGLFGLIGFFCILVWIEQRIFTKLKQTPQDLLTLAVACSFIIIIVHGLVDTTYWKNDLAFMWWTLMAMLI